MARTALRRSRAVESEDEEPSRQSTPASTAPRDGKRARRSSADDEEDLTQAITGVQLALRSQADEKPAWTNGARRSKPKHQPGAIVRVKLTNFVTYTSAEFFPGPNLNMVIGPNGTGKSTLVCAICLGLGWGTQYLGRAKDAAEFVKHGCREAIIEIELQRSLGGRNVSRANPVITRTIKREGNKSSYTLNGQSASGKAVMELARSFDIQIDNLCQFLPQDKVVEFAQMTPIEILQSTQRAAAPPFMLELHDNLKNLRKVQKASNDNKKNDRDALANLENRQEMQRTEVERLKERAAVQKRLGFLQRCRPIPQYAEAKDKTKEAKTRAKSLTEEHKRLKEESGPILKKVEAKRLYARQVQEQKQSREKEVKNAEKECDRLARLIDQHESTMKDCDQIEAAEKKSIQPGREDMSRTRVRITTLKAQRDQAPEPFDSRAMNEKIQDRVSRARTLESRLDDIKTKAEGLKQDLLARRRTCAQLKTQLDTLETVSGRQEDLLKSKSNDAYRAWEWIKNNRQMFRKQVFGPPMVECTLRDASLASSVESTLQQNDFRIFTVQCKEDFSLLQGELFHKQRLHDVSIRTCSYDSLDNFKPALSQEHMSQFGLKGWVIDCLDGPPTILAMLCQEKFLHQTAMTDTDITQAQHDQLSAIPTVKGYITKTNSYQFMRRAEYGAAGVHARERYLRKAEIWTNQSTDSGRKEQIRAAFREARGEHEEIKQLLPQLSQEQDGLASELAEVDEELKQLKAEKDEKQKALVEYKGLDTKITQAEEKIARLQQSLSSTNARLADNQRKRDEAMFAKAGAVLEYCDAVHMLREKTKALIEMEIALIEAKNDFDVLSRRNEQVVKMIEEKRENEKRALEDAARTAQSARQLMTEVKKLRDDGLELEEKENDRGLTAVLEELSSMDNPRESDLDDLIKVEEAKLELTEGGDANTLKEYEERAKKIEQLRSRLARMDAEQEEFMHAIRELRAKWEPPLEELVAQISDAFGDSFARIGCAGQVVVYKASSDDPADCADEVGGRENGLDFANWAIHISVKFRENEPLSLLDSHRQSGGERAVSTIFYLMALQSLSRAPFRVVDEINQGMDPRNERMVHGRMVDIAAADENGHERGSQYFLITPKLLSGLKYSTGMTVLCIVSGENMPSAAASRTKDDTGSWVTVPGKVMDFAAFARKAYSLGLSHGAGNGIDSETSKRRPYEIRGTLDSSQAAAAVGA